MGQEGTVQEGMSVACSQQGEKKLCPLPPARLPLSHNLECQSPNYENELQSCCPITLPSPHTFATTASLPKTWSEGQGLRTLHSRGSGERA